MMRGFFVILFAVWLTPAAASDFEIALEHARAGQMAQAAGGFVQLAEAGHTGAQVNLAVLYARGMGLPHDDLEAAYWAWRARLAGDRRAIDLADYLRRSLPEPLWPDLATRLHDSFAAQAGLGDHAALVSLGVVAAELAAPPRHQDAYVWFAVAAAFDVPMAVDMRDVIVAAIPPEDRRSAQEAAQAAFVVHCAALQAMHRVPTCPDS